MKTSSIDSFALEHHGHNLTSVARQGIFPPLVGYEAPDPFPTREVIALNYETLFARSADSEGSRAFVAPEQPPFDEEELQLI